MTVALGSKCPNGNLSRTERLGSSLTTQDRGTCNRPPHRSARRQRLVRAGACREGRVSRSFLIATRESGLTHRARAPRRVPDVSDQSGWCALRRMGGESGSAPGKTSERTRRRIGARPARSPRFSWCPALPMSGNACTGCGRRRADTPEGRRWQRRVQSRELPASLPHLIVGLSASSWQFVRERVGMRGPAEPQWVRFRSDRDGGG